MNLDERSFAFIKVGEFSHTNSQVLAQRQARFPDDEAEVVDLDDLNVIRPLDILPLLGSIAAEFGLAACLSDARIRRYMLKTRYFYRRARAALLNHLTTRRYVFTFQTQSLFDASCPGTPHFIYTDHTHRRPGAVAGCRTLLSGCLRVLPTYAQRAVRARIPGGLFVWSAGRRDPHRRHSRNCC
jgi:hypothetical protein